ncbi:STAS domain-containing protein [bacterium]|nr:STAS domain-containing protein [bacterium]NUN44511.1 STAS domain-containing protein [bacterium]
MDYNIAENNGVVVLELKGNIMGGPDATQLNDEIHTRIKQGKKNFVVNMQSVDLINSSGLGILISNLTTVKNNGGDLRLTNLSPKIKQIFQITKLATVFKQYDSVDDGVKSFV